MSDSRSAIQNEKTPTFGSSVAGVGSRRLLVRASATAPSSCATACVVVKEMMVVNADLHEESFGAIRRKVK